MKKVISIVLTPSAPSLLIKVNSDFSYKMNFFVFFFNQFENFKSRIDISRSKHLLIGPNKQRKDHFYQQVHRLFS